MPQDHTQTVRDRVSPRRAALGEPSWTYLKGASLDEFKQQDWERMAPQRDAWFSDRQADLVLDLFRSSRDVPTWGYAVNTHDHCLQAATLCLDAGYGVEEVVVALLHDVGLHLTPWGHGPFAAELLHRYVSETNYWLLHNHNDFVMWHCAGYGDESSRRAREIHKDHPAYEWGVEFAARFDAPAIDLNCPTLPLEAFAPAVEEIFARSPHKRPHRLVR